MDRTATEAAAAALTVLLADPAWADLAPTLGALQGLKPMDDLEAAVAAAIDKGILTGDLAPAGKAPATTAAAGDAVLAALQRS